MNKPRAYTLIFADVYPLYIKKVERKGHSKEEVDTIIFWLSGYNETSLNEVISSRIDFETFFQQAPAYNPNASLIKGVICGMRVEEITDEITQKIRYLDKLIDELAKGKAMSKILREA